MSQEKVKVIDTRTGDVREVTYKAYELLKDSIYKLADGSEEPTVNKPAPAKKKDAESVEDEAYTKAYDDYKILIGRAPHKTWTTDQILDKLKNASDQDPDEDNI